MRKQDREDQARIDHYGTALLRRGGMTTRCEHSFIEQAEVGWVTDALRRTGRKTATYRCVNCQQAVALYLPVE